MAENSYQGAVNKAKEAIGQIKKEVDDLDKKLQSVVKTLQDYQKKGIPSKITDQIKAQGNEIKNLEATVKSLTAKLEEQAKAQKNLSSAQQATNTTIGQQGASVKKLATEYDYLKEQQKKQLQSLRDLEVQGKQNTAEYKRAERTYKNVTQRLYEVDNAIKKLNPSTQKQSVENNLLNKILRENAVLLSTESNAYQKLVVKMNQVGRVVQSLTAKKESGVKLTKTEIKQLATAETYFKKYQQAVLKADAAIGRHQRNVGNYQSALGKLNFGLRNLMSAFGIIGGVTLFANLVKDAFSLTRTLDSMAFSMRAVITDARELGQTQEWLRTITEDYGAELVTTTNRYIKFRAAAQQAGFTAQETQNIFGTMTKAAGVLGLKTDELQGVFLALEQMISKGKITTEELRRQLGERLPGAMDIMARSMGKTTAELDKMMKAGEVITKDVLPGFAEEVERAFGLDGVARVETLQAATMRLKNAWTILVEDFNKGNDTTNILMNIINKLANNLGLIAKLATTGAKVFVAWKTAVIASALAGQIFDGSLKKMIVDFIIARKQAWQTAVAVRGLTGALLTNPITLFVVALGSLAWAFSDTKDEAQEATKEIIDNGKESLAARDAYNEVTKSVEELYERYKTLTEGMGDNIDKTKLSAEENAELETIIAKIGKTIPTAKTEVDRYSKALGLNTKAVEENIKARNEKVSRDAAADLQKQGIELKKLTVEQKTFDKAYNDGRVVRIEQDGKLYLFRKKGEELFMRVREDGLYKEKLADEEYTKIFFDRQAELKDQIASVEELSFANKLLLFETTGRFEEETRAYREKKKQDEDDAKRKQEAFDNSSVLANLQKDIDDAEAKRNEILKIKKIDNEKEYQKAIEEARRNLLEKDKDAYESSKKALEEAQKAFDEFTDKKGQKKGQNLDNQLEREEERRLKARIKAEKDLAKAQFDNAEASLKLTMDANQAIMDDEVRTGKERFQAMEEMTDDMNILAYERRKFEVKMAKLAFDEINESKIRSDEEKAKAQEALNEKLLAIDTDYQNALAESQRQSRDNFDSIASSEIKKLQADIAHKNEVIKQGYDEQIRKANDTFNDEKDALDKKFADGIISQEQYNDYIAILTQQREDEIQRIQRESAIKQLEQQIELAKQLSEKEYFQNDPQAKQALLDQIAQWEMDLSDMKTDHTINNLEREKEAWERLQEFKAEYIKGASQAIGDLLNIDSAHIEELFTKISDGIGKNAEDILATAGIVGNIMADIMGATAERNIERLEAQKEANDEYYDELLENEELSEEQKDRIQAEREKKNKLIDKKIREEKIKAAKAEKANALFQIGINTATAILGIWAQVPKWDFGISAAALTAFVSSLGALQAAAVLAKPIPKFEIGTKYAMEGLAIVDEKRPEVHTDRFGNVKSFGAQKPNLRYLERGDKIYPSHQAFFDSKNLSDIERFAWNMNLISNGDAITQSKMEDAMISTITGMRGDMNAMGKRIERLASRPINNNVKVKIEQDKPY